MKEKIRRLSNKCLSLADEKVLYHKDLYQEVVNLIVNGDFEEEKKLKLLVELYRYGFYNGVRTSLDPRGDMRFKTRFLIDMKDGLETQQISDELIEKSQQMNQMFRSCIDNPLDLIEQSIRFYSENPHAKF